jgi:Na+-transporting NADH:ubiquinone oxidoreductase subunit F
MTVRRLFRIMHRWLGLLMALQIIAWMASGLWFSIFPIEQIRGEHLTRPAEPLEITELDGLASPAALEAALDRHFDSSPWTLSSARWVRQGGQLYWRVSGESAGDAFTRLVGARDAQVQPMLTAAAAEQQALHWLLDPVEPEAVEWVSQGGADTEIRGRDLPLWRVRFGPPESLNLYLEPWTGEIAARRTDRWRVFDFFWMLHIMDFDGREDFNHPLLQIAAALGLIIALSGVGLWALTTRLLRRRTPQRAVL